ncbi:MAG: pyridoxal phosphate-dependent decarboxylase family protein [Magnetospiraceae bacterium]
MNRTLNKPATDDLLPRTAQYCQGYRAHPRPLSPSISTAALRAQLCTPLEDQGRPGSVVIDELINAAEPGLVGSTDPNFFAWVVGGSSPVGVAADWLTSAWGQNAALYQSSPAAAIAEEAVEAWLLDLLDLPRESSVGFVSGATMATLVGLAAARADVLQRFGHDFEANGFQGAPLARIYLSEDAHVANFSALRHLGFGDANFVKLPSDAAGLMRADDLAKAMNSHDGPKIIVAQAGHINSGGFEPLAEIAEIAEAHRAWTHVDGAFGLWARASETKKGMTDGAELADSWSVDGHKWLQLPYASGFAIIRNREAHRRAMGMNAGYLNPSEDDARDPSAYVPELSRRANGFAAWAVLRSLGRHGVADLIDRHCTAAAHLGDHLRKIDGLSVLNLIALNQVVVACRNPENEARKITELAHRLNTNHHVFVRTARWGDRTVLRLSVISQDTEDLHIKALGQAVTAAWQQVNAAVSVRGNEPGCISTGLTTVSP